MSALENQPLCFVLMPFGSKPDPGGRPDIDFNSIYRHAIKPGIADAEMFPFAPTRRSWAASSTRRCLSGC
jgi:hypothetical protein